jgi:hypothetical protein
MVPAIQIVVRREIDHMVMIDRRRGLLLVVQDAQRPIETLLLQGVELGREIGKGIEAHGSHKSRVASRATSNFQPLV